MQNNIWHLKAWLSNNRCQEQITWSEKICQNSWKSEKSLIRGNALLLIVKPWTFPAGASPALLPSLQKSNLGSVIGRSKRSHRAMHTQTAFASDMFSMTLNPCQLHYLYTSDASRFQQWRCQTGRWVAGWSWMYLSEGPMRITFNNTNCITVQTEFNPGEMNKAENDWIKWRWQSGNVFYKDIAP